VAVCEWCGGEMRSARSCGVDALHVQGSPVTTIRWGEERGWQATARCGDCGVLPGGFHHLGCDLQQCPMCSGQLLSCGCRFDEDGTDEITGFSLDGDFGMDSNGCLTERRSAGGSDVIVHYDDIPTSDLATVRGIPCTTALRTVIDMAPDLDRDQLLGVLVDGLTRRLFTVEEARARLAQPDMRDRRGAELLRRALVEVERSA
jgi:hypothetical protein